MKKTIVRRTLRVGIIMGSDSDLPTMQEAALVLEEFGVVYEMKITSAHRTPNFMASYSSSALKRGIKVIIAGAGGAAHLPGMSASHTPIPVIGVPIKTKSLDGLDSLLSIAQMPGGVPVAAVAIGGGKNAGLLAVQMLAISDKKLMKKMIEYKKRLEKESLDKNKALSH
ncbi:MAG: 5-(carboxyamino)imidazole ribonucleotide mutase [Bacteroidota bacterium]|nr:5-(carboxyamino)imidazole ribonucleotide mutase [Bacteroidota bacterium]